MYFRISFDNFTMNICGTKKELISVRGQKSDKFIYFKIENLLTIYKLMKD